MRIPNRGRFLTLLGMLVLTLIGMPFLSDRILGLPVMQIFLSGVMVAGVYAVSRHRPVLYAGAGLAAAALAISWWRHFARDRGTFVDALGYATDVLFFALLVVVILEAVLAERRVTADTIFGGISVYLLLGLVWAVLFSAIESFGPGSFVLDGQAIASLTAKPEDTPIYRELIYFSFVSLTTLGFGDITPTTPVARAISTAEATVGQLFVAIFIARLVGLHLANRPAEIE